MQRRVGIAGGILILFGCGHTTPTTAPPADASATSTVAPPPIVPDARAPDAGSPNLACSESADCNGAACCAERDTSGAGAIVTKCLPNCITNAPRVKVCKRDAECERGACKAFDCGPGAPSLLYCDRPDGCQ